MGKDLNWLAVDLDADYIGNYTTCGPEDMGGARDSEGWRVGSATTRGAPMSPTDFQLILGFLKKEEERFCKYLDDMEIEPTEGTLIIESAINEWKCRPAPCTEQCTLRKAVYGFSIEISISSMMAASMICIGKLNH